jgi:hypothetical protein
MTRPLEYRLWNDASWARQPTDSNPDKVFLELSAQDLDMAKAAIARLPMVIFWELEIYQVASPL